MNHRYGFGMHRAAIRSRGQTSSTPTPPFYAFIIPGSMPAGTSLTRASAGSYYDDTGLLASAASDTGCFDHDPSSLAYRGLRLEPACTNILAWSGTPGNAAWTPGSARLTRTSSDNIDPSGGTNAALFTGNGVSAPRTISIATAATLTSGTTYTLCVFLKAGTQSLLQLTGNFNAFGNTGYANFELTGAGGITSATVPATIQSLPNGWYRISIVLTAVANVASGSVGPTIAMISSPDDGRIPANTLTTSFLAWGASVTEGSSLSSYIETNAAASTRADAHVQRPVRKLAGHL